MVSECSNEGTQRRATKGNPRSSPRLLLSSSSSSSPTATPTCPTLPRTLLVIVPLVRKLGRLPVLLPSSSSSSIWVGDLPGLLLSSGRGESSAGSCSSSFGGRCGRKVDDVGSSWWRRRALGEEGGVEEKVVEVGLVRVDLKGGKEGREVSFAFGASIFKRASQISWYKAEKNGEGMYALTPSHTPPTTLILSSPPSLNL